MSEKISNFTMPTKEQIAAMSHQERGKYAAAFLEHQDAGFQPLALFKELARITVLSTFELTPFRSLRDGRKLEVLLAQRPENDIWWPNQYNLPGCVQLPTGVPGRRSYRDAGQEILDKEFEHTVALQGEPTFYDAQLRTGERGSEQTVFAYGDVEISSADGMLLGGKFFPVEKVLASPRDLGEGYGVVRGHELNLQNAIAHRALAYS